MRTLAALCLALLLSACVNNVDKFYKSHGTQMDPRQVILSNGPAEIIYTNKENFVENFWNIVEQGYVTTGNSTFWAEGANENQVQAVAQKVGASKVLFWKQYKRTDDNSFVMQMPDTTTTYHDGSIMALNSNTGNLNTAYLSGTSTTYGSTPVLIPNKVNIFDHDVIFFVKRKPGGVGVSVRDLNTKERKAINSNFGAAIQAVVKRSAAFKANLMRGDIILSFNDVNVEDFQHFLDLAGQKIGQDNIPMTIYRDGNVYTTTISIDPI
ncbi:PDZ domain-containing protein [Terasakiella sp. A23]|uniref:PDZ domain-containing protein n=1 Tax=Terasakiella sp. FCG-A23 TaxID=3080561 RepID=UPI002955BDFB|nr:PDZ domain-containing protein [Terasakiella sp. A23]MDV7340115.1 PDZ domain-containing protein [Terasakiella sp. A23]